LWFRRFTVSVGGSSSVVKVVAIVEVMVNVAGVTVIAMKDEQSSIVTLVGKALAMTAYKLINLKVLGQAKN
jgi:hypothetical protein